MTDGCGPTAACGSQITAMVQGMPMDRASNLTKEDLVTALDGLPQESLHCAQLALNTLQEAIANTSAWQHGGDDGQQPCP